MTSSPTCERQHEALRFGARFDHFGINCLTHLKHAFWVGGILEMSRIYTSLFNQDGRMIFRFMNTLARLNHVADLK